MRCVSTLLSLTFVPCVLAPHSSSCLVLWRRYDEGAARVHTPASNPVVIGASTPAGQDAYCGLLHDLRVGPSLFANYRSVSYAALGFPDCVPLFMLLLLHCFQHVIPSIPTPSCVRRFICRSTTSG